MARFRPASGPLLGLIASVGLLAASRGLDDVAREGQLGPGFWPRLVLTGLALACAAKLVEAWRAARARTGRDSERAATLADISRRALVAGVALIVMYVATTSALGFPIATVCFIALFMTLAGARSPLAIGSAAVLGTIALLYLFVRVVYLPLPKGDGPFEAVTIALYRTLRIF
jgi:putative tricarboxylic transport membrane protein